jgi:alpha-tubulin suppressor-like RCC1 family protein
MKLLATTPSALSPGRQLHRVGLVCGLTLLLFQAVTTRAATVTNVGAGYYHSLFVKSDGSLWAMGYNGSGQLGDGTTTNHLSPERIVSSGVTAIAGGYYHSLFVKSDGSLWAMGDNSFGQLGDGTTTNHLTPEQIVSSNVTAIAVGWAHSLFLKSNGSLWGTGFNEDGDLGDGTATNRATPEQIVSSNVTAIAAGWDHSLFLKSDGSLWAMGLNGYGELGDGTTTERTTPEQIVSSNVTAIAGGAYHSLFVKSDGSLWAMGDNYYGELGDGTTTNHLTPERIVSSGVTAIAGGYYHSLFVKSDGSLWAMGYNYYGQLGDGTTNNRATPEQIGLNSWIAGSGKWETGTNWSSGLAPSLTDLADAITNANTKTVTIDATTSGSFPNSLTINSLTVSAPGGAANTLFLNNAGTATPLQVLGVLLLGTNGAMVVNNSAVRAANSVSIGNSTASSSLVVSNGGSLIVTNGSGTGSVVVNGGSLILGVATFKTDNLVVTNGGVVQHTQTYQVDNSTVTIAGGSEQAGSNLVAGTSANSTGTVTVTDGGQLVVTNGVIGIGNNGTVTGGSGVGFMIVSNGTVLAKQILLGSTVGGQGQLTVQTNGLVSLVGTNAQLVANDLTVDGGDVEILNGQIFCGKLHPGAMTMSDGTANSQITYVGYDSQGTLTMVAGQMNVSSLLEIGFTAGSAGSVWMSGGQLTATALATTIGDQGVGQMSISNGTVTMADVFVGNSANPSTLILAGGTLTVNSLVLLNPSSQFLFSGGWLNALGITNSNGQLLTLGNGVSPITLNLLGGISSLGSGLQISANATVTGWGTINGSILNSGVIVSSGGALTFTGIVTNNGTMRANGGSVLENSGTVVNNGTIDIINGATNFHGVFINNGTVLTASSVKISQVSKSSPDMLIQIPSVTGHTYQLQYTTSLTPANWTFVASKPGTGGVLTFTDTGGAANPQRFYRVQVTAP